MLNTITITADQITAAVNAYTDEYGNEFDTFGADGDQWGDTNYMGLDHAVQVLDGLLSEQHANKNDAVIIAVISDGDGHPQGFQIEYWFVPSPQIHLTTGMDDRDESSWNSPQDFIADTIGEVNGMIRTLNTFITAQTA